MTVWKSLRVQMSAPLIPGYPHDYGLVGVKLQAREPRTGEMFMRQPTPSNLSLSGVEA